MKIYIIGIDGLELSIVNQYISLLPSFKKISEKGILKGLKTVFPADSVPAWNTIFTGLEPSEHGIIRGKDYIESVDEFQNNNLFDLKGKTFWDILSNRGKKCLVLNPFLAYPPWEINGNFVSGPAFVKGDVIACPDESITINKQVYGGYKPISSDNLENDIRKAVNDTKLLWQDFHNLSEADDYYLHFVTFTTLDRVQHYTWRYYDENDPLFQYEVYLSNAILEMHKIFDENIGRILERLNSEDQLFIISDHGFAQRPFNLINFNEILRKEGLLIVDKKESSFKTMLIQKTRNKTVRFLSKLSILDIIANSAKNVKGLKKFKKSAHLIDKENSVIFLDELFCGKKPYAGFNLGQKTKLKLSKKSKDKIMNTILEIFSKYKLPEPLWLNWNSNLFSGKYSSHYPDICFELPQNYGIEFELYSNFITKSVTHYKISGGHLNDGTYANFSKSGSNYTATAIKDIFKIIKTISV